jgi:hypothetical protein
MKFREEIMALSHTKIVPAAFWVGFLALGFATSVGGPNKHRVEHVTGPKADAAKELVAQTDKRAAAVRAISTEAAQD